MLRAQVLRDGVRLGVPDVLRDNDARRSARRRGRISLALQQRRDGEGCRAAAAPGRGERNPQRTSRACHHLTTAAASPSATLVVAPYITE